MPVLDFPLSKLEKYTGINPCPVDIDEYWDMALVEMNQISPDVELIPSHYTFPTTECFDLYFTGVKGARIHAKFARPKSIKKPASTVLLFHG